MNQPPPGSQLPGPGSHPPGSGSQPPGSGSSASGRPLQSVKSTIDVLSEETEVLLWDEADRDYWRRRCVEIAAHHDDEEHMLPRVTLGGDYGDFPLLPWFDAAVSVSLAGFLPDRSCFHWAGGELDVRGGGGHGLAGGMSGGVIRIHQAVGRGAGCTMTGGTLAIYGAADHRLGAAMMGGGIFVRGDAGDDAGFAGSGGSIVIGGAAGDGLGEGSRGVTFFVRGEVHTLGRDIVEAPMRKEPQLRLGVLLMNASISGRPQEFRRYVHRDQLSKELTNASEIRPSWR